MELLKLLQKYYVRWDVKRSATHCKGSQEITFGANIKFSSLKGSHLAGNLKEKIDTNGSHHVIHLMMSAGLTFVSNHLPCPLYLHICTRFSFILPCGQLICFWIAHTKAHIIFVQLDAQKHLHDRVLNYLF